MDEMTRAAMSGSMCSSAKLGEQQMTAPAAPITSDHTRRFADDGFFILDDVVPADGLAIPA